jgi:5'-nucleotidase
MDRRKFISTMIGGSVALVALPSLATSRKGTKITILHTNDTHSRIDPFPADDAKYPGLGGVSKRKALVDKIRSEEEHVLLLDAGDIFQGTPYFNLFGGEVEFKAMSAMGYDAATMGNHDFDAGLEGFDKVLPLATFPFLCANYDFSDTVLKDKTSPYKVFQKGDLRIGVFGVGVELTGLVGKSFYGETRYVDPVAVSQQMANRLKFDEKCNLVICLSHLGYTPRLNDMCDKVLAAETEHIHLIIGGHTHTVMEKCEEHKNKAGKTVLVNQVGWAGIALGRVDLYFDEKGNPDLFAMTGRNRNLVVG